MKFTQLPDSWAQLPAGWAGHQGGGLAEREGKQVVQPSAPLVADTVRHGIDGALQLSAVWACVELRSSLIASLPFFAYQRSSTQGHRSLARGTRLFSLLHDSPNARMTPLEFWRALILNHDLRGRAYARIDRAPDGEAVALWPMPSDQVESFVLDDGTMAYAYRIGNDVAVLAQENVLHLKGLGNGTEGLAKLDYMRATVHEAATAQGAASRMFSNGGKPTGVLMVDHVLKTEQRNALRERFAEMQTGSMARLFVLEADMKYQQLSLTPEQQQLLESRRFDIEEICRWFGVPPVLVHHSNVTTWGSGVEQILDGFYKLVIRPMLVSIEQAVTKRVLTSRQRAHMSVEIAFDALYRASLKDRMEIYAKAAQNGLKTRNECRQLENDPPMPGGDQLTVQSNLVPIQLLGRIATPGVRHVDPQEPVAQ